MGRGKAVGSQGSKTARRLRVATYMEFVGVG